MEEPRKVDVRLPGKGNLTPHGARPVHLIITMITWIRTSRLSRKNPLSMDEGLGGYPVPESLRDLSNIRIT